MVYLMDMESIFGVVEHNFKVILKKDYVVEKEYGKDLKNNQQIFIREIMREIKRMDLECINGLIIMNIEDNLLMIISMVMGR